MKDKQKAVEITRQRISKGRILVKLGKVWYLETCRAGVQRRRTLGTSDMNEAMRLQATLETAEDELPQSGPTTPKTEDLPATLTLGKAFEEYLDWYEGQNRESSLERTEQTLNVFVDALGAERDTKSITREDLQGWFTARKAGRSPATVRSDFNRVRALLYWISDRKDAIDRKICRRIDLPKVRASAKGAVSSDKVRAVLRALGSGWIADYARVLAETGMRPSELLGIRGTDLRGNLLSIKPHEGRDLKTEASERTIMLNATAAEILKARVEKMFDKKLPIFPNDVGGVFKENSVYHIFKDTLAGQRHGKVSPELDMTLYDFRHFFCSEHAAAGPNHMSMETLGAYIGHSAASTQTLARFYVDQKALLRGAPSSLIEEKDGEVIEMKKAKS
jgi:integrase